MIGRIKGVHLINNEPLKIKNEMAKFYLKPSIIGGKPNFIQSVNDFDMEKMKVLTHDGDVYTNTDFFIPVLEIDTQRISPSVNMKIQKLDYLYVNLENTNKNLLHIPLCKEWLESLKPKDLGELVYFTIETSLESEDFGKAEFKASYNYDKKG